MFETNFTKVGHCVTRATNLTAQEKILLVDLMSYAYGDKNYCNPSKARLAADLGWSTKTIYKWTKRLIEKGLIAKGDTSGWNKRNVYLLNTDAIESLE